MNIEVLDVKDTGSDERRLRLDYVYHAVAPIHAQAGSYPSPSGDQRERR